MFRTLFSTLALTSAIFAASGSASAQSGRGAPYTHAPSGIFVPGSLQDIDLVDVTEQGSTDNDVVLQFGRAGRSQTWAVVTTSRAAISDPALWFDVTRTTLETNDNVRLEKDVEPLVEYGAPEADSSHGHFAALAYPVRGRLDSAGVTITTHDGWLVTLQARTVRLEADDMMEFMDAALDQIRFPEPITASQPIAPIPECEGELEEEDAEILSLTPVAALLDITNNPLAFPSPSAAACYDTNVRGVYRNPEDPESYIAAVGGTGGFAVTQPVNPTDPQTTHRVLYFNSDVAHVLGHFEARPSRLQMLELVRRAFLGSRLGSAPWEQDGSFGEFEPLISADSDGNDI